MIVAYITTDSEAAMRKAAALFMGTDADTADCLAHIIQLAINDIVESDAQQPCRSVMDRLRRVTSFVKNSPKAKAELKRECAFERFQSLVQPVKTRWSSAWYMLDRYLALHHHVQEVIRSFDFSSSRSNVSKDDLLFTDAELEVMEALHVLLQPFEKITRHCEGEQYVTISHVPSWILSLCDAMAPIPGERMVRSQIRCLLRRSVRKRLEPFLEVRKDPETGFIDLHIGTMTSLCYPSTLLQLATQLYFYHTRFIQCTTGLS